jgi:hypothetical protein
MSTSLLSLPGEVRNIIYRFALTESAGLDYVEDTRGVGWLCLETAQSDSHTLSELDEREQPQVSDTTQKSTIANQMQFACRQLRAETKTLSIYYNTINFHDQTTTTLAVFLKSLPSHLRKVIQCLTISPKGTELSRRSHKTLSTSATSSPKVRCASITP